MHLLFKNVDFLKSFRNVSGIIKKLNSKDYFELFEIKRQFKIDEVNLSRKFKLLQMLYHPDKTIKLDKHSRSLADYNSTLVNNAYQTLKDSYKRGLHLLNLNNLTISESDSCNNLSAEFLIEMFEINENILKYKVNQAKLKEYLIFMESKINQIQLSIDEHFQNHEYEYAKIDLMKLNFYNSTRDKIKASLQ